MFVNLNELTQMPVHRAAPTLDRHLLALSLFGEQKKKNCSFL